jgi:hypothetical protein
MNTVVVFTKTNARVLNFEGDFPEWIKGTKHLINPSLEGVRGLPPHYWKMTEDHIIVPMTEREMNQRDVDIMQFGVDNEPRPSFVPKMKRIMQVRDIDTRIKRIKRRFLVHEILLFILIAFLILQKWGHLL